MLEKLVGVATILVAVTGLALISVFEPPIFVQIVCAFAGSIVFLFGVVVLFAEGQIWTKDRKVKKAPEVG